MSPLYLHGLHPIMVLIITSQVSILYMQLTLLTLCFDADSCSLTVSLVLTWLAPDLCVSAPVKPPAFCPWLWELSVVSYFMSACSFVALGVCSYSIPIPSQGPDSHPAQPSCSASVTPAVNLLFRVYLTCWACWELLDSYLLPRLCDLPKPLGFSLPLSSSGLMPVDPTE